MSVAVGLDRPNLNCYGPQAKFMGNSAMMFITVFVQKDAPAILRAMYGAQVTFSGDAGTKTALLGASNLRVPVIDILTVFIRDQQGVHSTPVMVTLVDADGRPVLQNSSSVGFFGYLAPNKVKSFGSNNTTYFWDFLFGLDKASYKEMTAMLGEDDPGFYVDVDGIVWSKRIKVLYPFHRFAAKESPPLVASARQPPATSKARRPRAKVRWHDLQVFRVRDPVTCRLLHVVIQTDATEAHEACLRTRAMAHSYRALLRRLLPEHVTSALLESRRYSTNDRSRRLPTSSTPNMHSLTDQEQLLDELSGDIPTVAEQVWSLGQANWGGDTRDGNGAQWRITPLMQQPTMNDGAQKNADDGVNDDIGGQAGRRGTISDAQSAVALASTGRVADEVGTSPVSLEGNGSGEMKTIPRNSKVIGIDQQAESPFLAVNANRGMNGTPSHNTSLTTSNTHAPTAADPAGLRQPESPQVGQPPSRVPDQGIPHLTTATIRTQLGGRSLYYSSSIEDGSDSLTMASPTLLARYHPNVSVLYADIKGFTKLAQQLKPRQVMRLLNRLYTRVDSLLPFYGVHKVETIGDCYVAASGLFLDCDCMARPADCEDRENFHARRLLGFARSLVKAAGDMHVRLRVGLHCGPVRSGVVGSRMPRFCLLGGTMTEADAVQSAGLPGKVVASRRFASRLQQEQWVAMPKGCPVPHLGVMMLQI